MEGGEKIGSGTLETIKTRSPLYSGKSRKYPFASVYERGDGLYAVLDGEECEVLLGDDGKPVTEQSPVLKGLLLITLIIKRGAMRIFQSVYWRNPPHDLERS